MSAPTRRGSRVREETVRFTFDGREYLGQRGDTAASALLAAGVRRFGRSVKYRRLRGVLTASAEEPNALLTVGRTPAVIPNVVAPQLEIVEGLELRSQNRWPSLDLDVASLLQAGGGFFGAGFYYKTFIWPSWRTYESMIRSLAGLGEAPRASELGEVAVEHLHCDVLVAGAGPAGLAAARAAARAGARVVLCERDPACGGELEFETGRIDGREARDWVGSVLAELKSLGVRVLTGTTLVAASGGEMIAHAEPGGLPGRNTMHKIVPRTLVVAMGAVERPIAFTANDLPGVMLLGAAERYLACYGARAAASAVIFANHDRAYPAALRLADGGIRIAALVDTRAEPEIGVPAARDALRLAGVRCLAAHAVLAAHGGRQVSGATIAPLADPARPMTIACDAILVSGGWSPALHAGVQEGGQREFDPLAGGFVARAQPEWRFVAGAANGALELGAVLVDAHAAGERAARRAGASGSAGRAPAGEGDAAPGWRPFWRSPAPRADEKRQFIDWQNDVTVADIRQSLAEGFRDIEHLKRYTALGFGGDQGRLGGLLGAAVLAELRGEPLAEVGTSRLRPPFHPVTMRSLAGLRAGAALRPARCTPLHAWHESHGAVLESMGLWMRPRYYRANGVDSFAAGIAEARRVRESGGIADGSTLGKIEVAGPEAAAFLDAMYLTRASTIKPGRAKYMVNLREDGLVLDDGLVLRVADDRFIATTSSGHGLHMLSHFEHYRDAEWGGRGVTLTDVTEAWAAIVVAGPRSRDALGAVLGAPWQVPLAALRHMDFARGSYAGHDLTVLRASFSGELAFELHCRPAIALALWEALIAAGLPPYGLEALDILRVEKGYLTTAEINGQTTPYDLGMESLVKLGNPCVGRELLGREAFHEPSRPRLVGLRAADGRGRFLAGAQLVVPDAPSRPLGHVTSTVYSPALGEWIGLALVARSHAADGTPLLARDPVRDGDVTVRVVPTVHFDPSAERMKA
ncbi:MAG: (2Fe-2S)-binding protein [Proteobacteria bacterium]|nr:(2Fe-2S)-binding protein [Pseudomonadota bacterium]